jgi:AcrR family transcriptional regulator
MRRDRFEEILKCSAELISQNGFNGVSFREIAERIGLHKSSLFHYIKNKEELLLRILEHSVDKVNTNLEKIIANNELKPKEKLNWAIDNHLTSIVEHFDNVNIYLNELTHLSKKNQAVYLKKRKKYERDFEKIITEMQGNGYFKGLDTKIVTFGILGMLNWVVKWYKRHGDKDIKEVSNIFYRLITTDYEEKTRSIQR